VSPLSIIFSSSVDGSPVPNGLYFRIHFWFFKRPIPITDKKPNSYLWFVGISRYIFRFRIDLFQALMTKLESTQNCIHFTEHGHTTQTNIYFFLLDKDILSDSNLGLYCKAFSFDFECLYHELFAHFHHHQTHPHHCSRTSEGMWEGVAQLRCGIHVLGYDTVLIVIVEH